MQPYEPRPLEPERAVEAYRARSLADAKLGDVQQWDLPQLTQAALRLHPDLAVARAQWRAAQAAEITAGQKPNPTLSAGGEHHSRADGISPWTFTLGIDIPIETHGKREARIAEATALSDAAKLDIAQTAWQVRSRLRTKLLDLYAIEVRARQLQREADVRIQIVALLEARANAGLVAGTDLADARLLLQKSRTALEAETARRAEARAAIAASIGVPAAAFAGAPISFAAFEHDTATLPAEDVQRAALFNRPEVRKALANYAAAEARLQLEIAKQYPDFSIAPGYSWDQGDNRWGLSLVSIALSMLNKNEGPIKQAQAQREVLAQQFNALQASVIGEQAQALAAWQAAKTQTDKTRQLVDAQQARLAQTQRQFDAGYADRLELTTAQLELVTAQAAVLDAQLNTQRALGQLEDAVQQPLDGSAPLPALTEEAP